MRADLALSLLGKATLGVFAVRAADRKRDHLLQLRHPVAATHEVRGERQRERPGADQEAVAGGVAPHPPKRALHFPRRRTSHRSGCHRGGAGVGVTEFSGVWAYNPLYGARKARYAAIDIFTELNLPRSATKCGRKWRRRHKHLKRRALNSAANCSKCSDERSDTIFNLPAPGGA